MRIVLLNAKNSQLDTVTRLKQFIVDQKHEIVNWHKDIRYKDYDAVISVLNEDEDDLLSSYHYERDTDVMESDLVTVSVGRGLYEAYDQADKINFVAITISQNKFVFCPIMESSVFHSGDWNNYGNFKICIHPWFQFEQVSDLPFFKANSKNLLLYYPNVYSNSKKTKQTNYKLLLLH